MKATEYLLTAMQLDWHEGITKDFALDLAEITAKEVVRRAIEISESFDHDKFKKALLADDSNGGNMGLVLNQLIPLMCSDVAIHAKSFRDSSYCMQGIRQGFEGNVVECCDLPEQAKLNIAALCAYIALISDYCDKIQGRIKALDSVSKSNIEE